MPAARRLILLAVSGLALVQAGCAVVALGAAGAVGGGAAAIGISRGTVVRSFDASVEATATATQSALKDLGLPVERPKLGTTFSEIDSTGAGGEPILLTLRAEPSQVPTDPPHTRIEVLIKVFGDKKLSERLLDQVSYRLKNPAPPATQTTTVPPPPPLPDQTDEPALASPSGSPTERPVNATEHDLAPPPSTSSFMPPKS